MMSTQAVGASSRDGGGGGGQQPTTTTTTSGTMPTRQGSSMYNLTLNEVQHHLGEPLLSMNLDDLLWNVLPLEQPNTTESGAEEEDHHLPNRKKAAASLSGPVAASSCGGGGGGGIVQRPGSVTLLSRAVSKRTVDEVWKDIQKGQQQRRRRGPGIAERQATLGEMTLEDFLMKAGIVAEASWDGADVPRGELPLPPPPPAHCHWLQQQQPLRTVVVGGTYGVAPHHPHPLPLPLQAVASGPAVMDVGYSDKMGSISSPIAGTMSDSPAPGRKRAAAAMHGIGDVVEKTVERRLKRMIKNRESAARSRARKQAYTNELENKVSRLEEENELLKKQQELDRILYSTPIPEPKFRLRRTSSAPL